MPTYAYRCTECNSKYEIFFKTKEETEEIHCPNCSSDSYKKVMSATNIGSMQMKVSQPAMPPCATGGCSPGMCNLN